ncbi:MAG: TolC family protein [Salibacteraceae bacterium]
MKLYSTVLLSLLATLGSAQSVLTLDEAFAKALSNNFDVQVVRKQLEIAENSATIGNAGLLPSVSANASAGINVNNTELEFAGNLPPVNQDNAQSTNTNANLTANYTLFRGLSGQRTYQKLKLNRDLMNLQKQAAIEATLLQVANAYFVLARAEDQIDIAEENVELSSKRFERAKLANTLGTSLRTELLSARVDLTTDSSSLLNAQLQHKTALRQLEQLIATDLPTDTKTALSDTELKAWSIDELVNTAKVNNAVYKNSEMQVALAEKDYQISMSSIFPSLSVSGGYSFNNQQTEAGIVLSNTATGWNGSVALSYPLFNGFKNSIQRQNQIVTKEIRELEMARQELQLITDLENAFDSYLQSFKVAKFEASNLESAELNVERADALYKSGQITSIQFREAQVGLTGAKVRLSNAQISTRLNELEVLRLTGQILSE